MTIKLTPEGQEIYDTIQRGESVMVGAVAGAGKSTVAASICNGIPEDTCYIVYTRANRHAMQQRIRGNQTIISTINGYAKSILDDMVGAKVAPFTDAHLNSIYKATKSSFKVHMGHQAAWNLLRLKFPHLTPDHSSDEWYFALDHICSQGDIKDRTKNDIFRIYEDLYKYTLDDITKGNRSDFVSQIWAPLHLEPEGSNYWTSYSPPRVFVDELQDISAATLELLKRSTLNSQLLGIGDEAQCLVEGTLVSTPTGQVPIENLNLGDTVIGAKGSLGEVTGKFSKTSNELVTIKTSDGKEITCTVDHPLPCDFVEPEFTYFVYLMYKKGVGSRIGLSSTTSGSLFSRAAKENADKCWILKTFSNEHDARVYECVCSVKYSIPTQTYRVHNSKVGLQQEHLDQIFSQTRRYQKGSQALKDHNLTWEDSHYRPQGVNRRVVTVTLCEDTRSTNPLHTIRYEGKAFSDTGDKYVRVRKQGKKLVPLLSYVPDNSEVRLKIKAVKGRKSTLVRNAGNVRPGMSLVNESGEYVSVVSVEHISETKTVWDIQVNDTHTFFANGLLSKNCILTFAGAYMGNMDDFMHQHGCVDLPLTTCFRCSDAVIDLAQTLIPQIKGTGRLEGSVEEVDEIDMDLVRSHDMLVSARYAPMLSVYFDCLKEGIPVRFEGRDVVRDIQKELREIQKTQSDFTSGCMELREMINEEILDIPHTLGNADLIQKKQDLKNSIYSVSRAFNTYSDAQKALDLTKEDKGTILMTSIHRAKGLEADRVLFLDSDGTEGWQDIQPGAVCNERLRLAYVAITRAVDRLTYVPMELDL